MFKTIYRLRILVKDQYHSIHLCALKEKEPTFLDLLKKVQRITEDTNVLNDYHLATIDTKAIVSDDQSLRNALKSCTRLDITLERKQQLKRKNSSLDIPTILPIIKPTVLRWTPAIILPPSNISYVRLNQHQQDDDEQVYRKDNARKDSGISLYDQQDEEPRHPYKKQRVHSADFSSHHHHHQKPTLPALSSITCLPPLLTSQQLQQQQHLPPIQQQQQPPLHPARNNNNNNTTTNVFLCEHVTQGKRCGQTFRRSYDLSRHQTIHLPNRPFCYCQQCGKKFTRMDALRRHERVQGHVGSKQQQKRSMSLPTGQARV